MRKILFLLLTATVLLWSCQNKTVTIQGTVADPAFEGATVYLQESLDGERILLESTTVENGTFTFTGLAANNAVVFISMAGWHPYELFLERGTIKVVVDDAVSITGTKLNELFNDFRASVRGYEERQVELVQQFNAMHAAGTLTEAIQLELVSEHGTLGGEIRRKIQAFIKDNIQNETGKHLLRTMINSFDDPVQRELIALADDHLKTYPSIARIITRWENAKRVAPGNPFIDFTANDPAGSEVSISDFAGHDNYTLIVFWASWCGPCIVGIPHLREVYARYQDKGFEILGVSLDGEHDAWVNAIAEHQITWSQMSDLMVWQSPVVELYAFRSIPHTVLLNREGYIIANGLRGDALDRKLAELMP